MIQSLSNAPLPNYTVRSEKNKQQPGRRSSVQIRMSGSCGRGVQFFLGNGAQHGPQQQQFNHLSTQ